MINIFISEIPQTFDIQKSAESFKSAFRGEENALYVKKLMQKKSNKSVVQSICALCTLSVGMSKLSIDTQELIISKTDTGKPYFVGENTPYFSISHDANTVAVAISNSPVGIDIQSPRDTEQSHKIAERFFSKDEAKDVLSGKTDFLALWTMKEALCKLRDVPLPLVAKNELPQSVSFKTIDYKGFRISVASDVIKEVKFTFLNDVN